MSTPASRISENIQRVYGEIAQAARQAQRDPADVVLIAVSKATTTECVAAAIECGIVDFAENRIAGLDEKLSAFPVAAYPKVNWHFIGSLQTNKVKHVVGRVALIHSVDSLHLLEKIDRVAQQKDVVQPVLLQVNISGEATKHGFVPNDMDSVIASAAQYKNVKIKGLMTMAPVGSLDCAQDVFWRLSRLSETLQSHWGDSVELGELSMGMSGDFVAAVAEGATMVRVGQALFA